jgi:hypothetical protein
VSETPENTALAELLRAISDRRIRRKVQKLLTLGEEAVRALGELDAALYVREDGEEQLQIVADAVLSHFRRLLEFTGMVATATDGAADDAVPEELDLDAPSGRQSQRSIEDPARRSTMRIIATRDKTDDEKWNALAGEMGSFRYGLTSELREFDRRFADALKNDRKEQALVDLNDATTALMDGVFAVMTTVYECFLGHAEPERMIPGHRDTLGKALAVRRAIAELRRTVRSLNASIQDRAAPPAVAQSSYQQLVDAMVAFIESDVFFYLRSDTRKDFDRFREQLATGNASRNRLDCEGLDKYLDSLAFVSQRGVLIKHDTDLKAKIAVDVERALAYAKVVPELVVEVIQQAFVKAERLLGLNDQIDTLVERWSSMHEWARSDPDDVVPLASELFELVRPPRASAPDSGDFI